ncbi:hypothetical protein APUTEX25_003838, partial [Auxenochlorella protothecoides]
GVTSLLLGCAVLAVVAGQAVPTSEAGTPVTKTIPLTAFSNISICTPLNTLVLPGPAGQYGIVLSGEPEVLAEIDASVTGQVLSIVLNGPIDTSQEVKVTVMLPADALSAVEHYAPGADVVIARGFQATDFSAKSAFGAGELYIQGLTATNVHLDVAGLGNVVLEGTYTNVAATSSGTGSLYIVGVSTQVSLQLSGLSKAYVIPSGPTASITGSASGQVDRDCWRGSSQGDLVWGARGFRVCGAGINNVYYTTGTCDVASQFAFLGGCQLQASILVPPPTGVWTCGLVTSGAFQCATTGSTYSTSATGATAVSGAVGSQVLTGTTAGTGGLPPSSYSFAVPAAEGGAQQAGSVTPTGSNAASSVAGSGPVSAVSVAGPGSATTSTTQDGVTTTGGTGLAGFSPAAGRLGLEAGGVVPVAPLQAQDNGYSFSAPGAQQAGAVTPTGTNAASSVVGTGSVSAVASGYHTIFEKYDRSHSRALNVDDVRRLLDDFGFLKGKSDTDSAELVLSHFTSADQDRDSKLSFDEFSGLYSKSMTNTQFVKLDHELLTRVRQVFARFAAFGAPRPSFTPPRPGSVASEAKPGMDCTRLVKLCRDAGIVRGPKSVTTVELAFAKAKPKAGRRIGFRDFLRALSLIAESKGVPEEDVLASVAACPEPTLTQTTITQSFKHHVDRSTESQQIRVNLTATPGT